MRLIHRIALRERAGKPPMHWQEPDGHDAFVVPDDVVDVVYRIRCRELRVDHAHDLSQALLGVLPWLAREPLAGVHTVHVAEAGNGWLRPQGPDALMQLSRRARLTLRLPRHRLEDARALVDAALQVGDHVVEVGTFSHKSLSSLGTLIARHVADTGGGDETVFLERALRQLSDLGVRAPKLLAGRARALQFPQGPLATRSLMVAGLSAAHSVKLQQHGIGSGRITGCGLFLPHKGIEAVHEVDERL